MAVNVLKTKNFTQEGTYLDVFAKIHKEGEFLPQFTLQSLKASYNSNTVLHRWKQCLNTITLKGDNKHVAQGSCIYSETFWFLR